MSLTLRRNLSRPMTFNEMDDNPLYLQSLAGSGGGGALCLSKTSSFN